MMNTLSKAWRYLRANGKKKFVLRVAQKLLGMKETRPAVTAPVVPAPVAAAPPLRGNGDLDLRHLHRQLNYFLASSDRLVFPETSQPLVSLVILLYNRAEVTLQCLTSIIARTTVPYEVILVDNASTDQTRRMLEKIEGAKVMVNASNLGFVAGCNQGAAQARGKYLLFLNNDVELTSDAVRILAETLENSREAGAAGGKLVFPDGTLQEAGSIIWSDGATSGYGRGDQPDKPEYNYLKEVYYCSGAMLLTPRELFASLGGFQECYQPAYYEETDYCMLLRKNNRRVFYQPAATAWHHEFGSAPREAAIQLQARNREIFVNRWAEVLKQYLPREGGDLLRGRECARPQPSILVVEDRIPDPRLGCGYPRSFNLLMHLREIGCSVTLFPMLIQAPEPETNQILQQKSVEVMSAPQGGLDFGAFLRDRRGYYDAVFVSRPHNLEKALPELRRHAAGVPVIYDAEAVFTLRDILYKEAVKGETVSPERKAEMIGEEMNLAKAGDAVVTVSEGEQKIFREHGIGHTHVLGSIFTPMPTPRPFTRRRDLLFVGSVLHSPSPNEDALLYLVREIFPHIRRRLECRLWIVGTVEIPSVWKLQSEDVRVTGRTDDLTPYYDQSRVFVVPTRYSAGIPLKLLEAASRGLPVVTNALTAGQLGWQDGEDLLVGDTPEAFAGKVVSLYQDEGLFLKLRENALRRVAAEYSEAIFHSNLRALLHETVRDRPKAR